MSESTALADTLARLHRAGLAADLGQLLDSLWLARWLSRHGAVADAFEGVPEPARPQFEPPAPDPQAAPPPAPPPAAPAPQTMAELPIGEAAAAATAAHGLYAGGGAAAGDDTLRARAVRVAGVAALRDAPALASALRPLGKRRRSRTRFEFDEAATVDAFAETGVLLPLLAPLRERFFTATLLVEDSPALPLWRAMATELEDLLARQGGFRRFRRYALVQGADSGVPGSGSLVLASRSGARHAPEVLCEDDASLVLLATDGTTAAWADGRMAALVRSLGRHSSVALLQWMPERRWPHTALGAADALAWQPRPGAAQVELQWQRPRWLDADEAVQAVPLAALTPASLATLSAVLMAKPGAKIGAALLWPSAQASTGEEGKPEPADADERIRRFLGLASPRLLQAAVQLSAAAPLTLPVVRLVHHVMQPGAPAEDLPLLLLSGLLERQSAQRQEEAPGGRDDDDVSFEFAPGVRAALQRSLSKSDAAAVRHAVSTYIAERSGAALDFSALLLDPQGALKLPSWARPFAEVTRQVQQLFVPREAPAALLATVQERQWSPGVTVQAEIELPGQVRQMQWSRDGQRLAVLHEYGLEVLRLAELSPGRRQWQREPLAMRAPVHVLFVKGFDIDEAAAEALIARVRNEWASHFRGELEAQYHTVADVHRRNPERSARADVQRLTKLIRKPRALVCCIGGPSFFASGWLREAVTQWSSLLEDPRPPMLAVVGDNPTGSGTGAWRVHRLLPTTRLGEVSGRADAAGSLLLALLRDLGARALAEVAFGADASGIAWDHLDRLLVADARRGSVLRHDSLELVLNFASEIGRDAATLLAAHHGAPVIAVAGHEEVHVFTPGGARPAQTAAGANVEALAWSSEGDMLAWRLASGEMSELPIDVTGAVSFARRVVARQCAAGPAWSRRGERLAYGLQDGSIQVESPDASRQIAHLAARPEALEWSHDDRWLAIARRGGHIKLLVEPQRESMRQLESAVPEPEEGASTTLAFVPRALDEGYEALAVVHGHRLTLLRVAAAAFQAVAAPPSPREPPAPWATPEQATEAACDVLHSMALAFHVGRLLPGEGFASRVYGDVLGIAPDSPDGRTLAQLSTFTEWLFHDTVKRALRDRDDPIARPDQERGRAIWRDACEAALRHVDALTQYVQGGPPRSETLGGSTALNDVIEHWRWAHGLWAADGRADDGPVGWLSVVGVDYAKMMAYMQRLASESLSRQVQLELLSAVSTAISGMPADHVADAFAAQASRRAWLIADRGDSAFSDCRRFDDYLDRFIEHWARYAEQLKRLSADSDDRLELGFAAPLPSLKRIESLFEALKLGIDIAPTESEIRDGVPRHEWSLPHSSYAPLVQMLGAIITTQVARKLGGATPLAWGVPGATLLWVDDKPNNNRRECEAFNRRGFRMLLADDTDGALQAMDAEHVDAVISDMSRPGDRRAGYTLLGRLRERGSGVPFLLYTTPVILAELGDSPLPGPTVTTDQFQELEAALRSLFTTPPAA